MLCKCVPNITTRCYTFWCIMDRNSKQTLASRTSLTNRRKNVVTNNLKEESLAIQMSMKIWTFAIQPLINTFQKIQMCASARKGHRNDEAVAQSDRASVCKMFRNMTGCPNLLLWHYWDDWLTVQYHYHVLFQRKKSK